MVVVRKQSLASQRSSKRQSAELEKSYLSALELDYQPFAVLKLCHLCFEVKGNKGKPPLDVAHCHLYGIHILKQMLRSLKVELREPMWRSWAP